MYITFTFNISAIGTYLVLEFVIALKTTLKFIHLFQFLYFSQGILDYSSARFLLPPLYRCLFSNYTIQHFDRVEYERMYAARTYSKFS